MLVVGYKMKISWNSEKTVLFVVLLLSKSLEDQQKNPVTIQVQSNLRLVRT